jgi:AAA family ATP:ADP antiporter
LARFGQFTNIISFVISFFCFTFLVNNVGVKHCLLIFPSIMIIGIALVAMFPHLWLIFLVVSILKALIFSFFDPLKEILYVPTSDAIKFKAASWIEVFGARLAKALGSFLNRLVQRNVHSVNLELLGIAVSLGSMLIYTVWQIGTMFDGLIEEGRVVGNSRQGMLKALNSRFAHLPVRNGVKPGEVGYDGYDMELFEGVVFDRLPLERSATV